MGLGECFHKLEKGAYFAEKASIMIQQEIESISNLITDIEQLDLPNLLIGSYPQPDWDTVEIAEGIVPSRFISNHSLFISAFRVELDHGHLANYPTYGQFSSGAWNIVDTLSNYLHFINRIHYENAIQCQLKIIEYAIYWGFWPDLAAIRKKIPKQKELN